MLSFVDEKSEKPRQRKANRAFKHTNNIFDTDNEARRTVPSQSISQESYTTVSDRLSRSPVSELERRIEKLPPRLRLKVVQAIAHAQKEHESQKRSSDKSNNEDERFIGYEQRSRSFEIPSVNRKLGQKRAVTAYTQGHIRDRVIHR